MTNLAVPSSSPNLSVSTEREKLSLITDQGGFDGLGEVLFEDLLQAPKRSQELVKGEQGGGGQEALLLLGPAEQWLQLRSSSPEKGDGGEKPLEASVFVAQEAGGLLQPGNLDDWPARTLAGEKSEKKRPLGFEAKDRTHDSGRVEVSEVPLPGEQRPLVVARESLSGGKKASIHSPLALSPLSAPLVVQKTAAQGEGTIKWERRPGFPTLALAGGPPWAKEISPALAAKEFRGNFKPEGVMPKLGAEKNNPGPSEHLERRVAHEGVVAAREFLAHLHTEQSSVAPPFAGSNSLYGIDRSQLIERIAGYIGQQLLGNASEINLGVNHRELGRFKINVSQEMGESGVQLTITTFSKEGGGFFALNQARLLSGLGQQGISVQDFKLEQQSNVASNHLAGTGQGQNLGDFSAHQDSQRRRELWRYWKGESDAYSR